MIAITAFIAPMPLVAHRRCNVSTPRRARVYTPHFTPRMDLLSNLVFKAVEVGAATYATTMLSGGGTGTQNSTSNEQGVHNVPNFTALPAQLQQMLRSAESVAAELPALLERSDPAARRWVKLAICLVIDLIGSGSLPVPLLADALDLVWAPIAALALHALFGNPLITATGFAEEILPGTDGLPTASLAWIYEYYGDDIGRAVARFSALDVAAKEAPVAGEESRKRGRAPFGGAFRRRGAKRDKVRRR